MKPRDPFRFLHGPYQTPRARPGSRLSCEIRGTVVVGRFSDGPIPWPCVKRRGKPTLILCGDLVKAVRCESKPAVAHHFGVSAGTVRTWRRALDVPAYNEGTRARFRQISIERTDDRLERGRRNSKIQESLAKLSAKLKGRTIPPHVIEAVRKAAQRPRSSAWKEKMVAFWRRRGHPVGHPERSFWTEQEIRLLRTGPAAAVARKIGRSLSAVYGMRYVMKTTRINPTTRASVANRVIQA